MPKVSIATRTRGPVYRSTASPYNTTNQNEATSRKLYHGSPVVHDSSPAKWLSGRMKEWLYANALVTWGGVASNKGDFWWIRTLALLRLCESPFEAGAKAATVGFASPPWASLSLPWPGG